MAEKAFPNKVALVPLLDQPETSILGWHASIDASKNLPLVPPCPCPPSKKQRVCQCCLPLVASPPLLMQAALQVLAVSPPVESHEDC